jgi:hypothetical protein
MRFWIWLAMVLVISLWAADAEAACGRARGPARAGVRAARRAGAAVVSRAVSGLRKILPPYGR